MPSGRQSMQVFAELLPLNPTSYSTMLLRPNLRHVVSESRVSTFDPTVVHHRIIALSFAALLSRQCLSFGSSRSNDYQLPISSEVAPHHFLLFFNVQERQLYLRNTCSEGVYILSRTHGNLHIQSCDVPVQVISPMRLQIGQDNELTFEITIPATYHDQRAYENHLSVYINSLHQPSLTPTTSPGQIVRKRQGNRSISQSAPIQKRHCQDAQGLHACHPALQEPGGDGEGWFTRITRTVSSFWGISM